EKYSFGVVDGELYYRETSMMAKPNLSATAKGRVMGMVELRDCVHRLIDLQMEDADENSVQKERQTLNSLYDAFSKKYGLINNRENALAFSADNSYFLLCSLEMLDNDGRLERKADMFTKRTIKPHRAVTHVDTASEALAVSIGEKARVDMSYMAQLTGKTEEELELELSGVIFRDVQCEGDPSRKDWTAVALDSFPLVAADEYLSGNVRQKLRAAKAMLDALPEGEKHRLRPNVEALESAQPQDLTASEIDLRLGATWLDKRYVQQFMYELFKTPPVQKNKIHVNFSEYTGEWNITGKNTVSGYDVAANTTYGTDRLNAYHILEDTLNLRDVRIYDTIKDPDGKERRVLNHNATTLAQQKQQAIKDAFRDWIWKDPQRRQTLEKQYNELFNSIRPREYDGRHIVFGGINPEITLREHQLNAIAHVLYGGNTLLAHEVGAGKTFEMVAAAMESKRLGLCQKSLFAVPNHLIEQWASEFLRLYPTANILVASKKDFEGRNRKKFCSRIATGNYDAIIMGHSQFERLPVSYERREQLLQDQILEIEQGIEELEDSGAERFSVKQLERTKRSLEARLEKINSTGRKDSSVTFEQLGVDRLFIDEAHSYKNLFLYTKMRNVAGLSTTDAQKSSDMLLKCRYMDEITGGRGTTFATGTPVSNSVVELYTMMCYLQFDTLEENGHRHFDAWAADFGEKVTAMELRPEGTGFRAKTRFAKFYNLPELISIWKEAADIQTADMLKLPVPEAEHITVTTEPSAFQKEMVAELGERAEAVRNQEVDPSTDNLLRITSDGRKLALDQRLQNPLLPDDPSSKVNACVKSIFAEWQDSADIRGTQLVFSDLSTPKGDGKFNVYDDIKSKLIAQGIPQEEIAFIHDANTEAQKAELFAKVRRGQVRVLLGSTQKMGAGTNLQDRIVASHDLDCPWRPADLEPDS
ncbi:MAG: DEAD/DEAH box helicase family protein, partial [Oscillospiraceae bacterium]|nr:DEAD/DEAH box helicase family protein [Oscillospiraceae bacterium]